jgi:CrcB protein
MVDKLKRNVMNTLFPRDTHPELPLNPDSIQTKKYRQQHFIPGLQLVVFFGGCLGTLARYEIENLMPAKSTAIPYNTLFINLLGAFILGMLLESLALLGEDKGWRKIVRLGLGTGFIGAFTTYSTFAVEVSLLVRQNQDGLAFVYASISIIGGLICCATGIHIAERYRGVERSS